MAVVVDTDVVSFLFKRDTRAQLYRPRLANHLMVISFMTLAELERWTLQHNWGARRKQQLERHLRRFVLYPFDRNLCRLWAEVADGARRHGRPINTADAWVAATALHFDIPLVTHNASDYAGVPDLMVISESR